LVCGALLGLQVGSVGVVAPLLGQALAGWSVWIVLGRWGSGVPERLLARRVCGLSALLQGLVAGEAYGVWAMNATPAQLGGASVPLGVVAVALFVGATGGVFALITSDMARHWFPRAG